MLVWWPKVVFWLRLAAVAWAATIPIVLILQTNGLVPALPKLETAAWIISLVVLGVDNLGTLISRAVHRRIRSVDGEVEKVLLGALNDISRSAGIQFWEMGASVYRPSRLDRMFRPSREPRRLVRIKRFRPTGYPQQSGVNWAPGKGVVGVCWESRKELYKDWTAIARAWGGSEINDDQFGKIPHATRMGFTRREFATIADKYAEIIAVPIWHSRKDNKMIGVLSIDRSFRDDDASVTVQLGKKGTREVAAATASVVSRILVPNREDAD